MNTEFLPISRAENGNNDFDFICVTGDAYVDHPSFGIAIISRLIESLGFSVGIIAQPQNENDFKKLGKPRYAFMVTSGNIDSMVSNYTVALRKRSEDFYSPGGVAGKRPDRAVIVYTKKLKELYPETFVVIGGLEASLRRFAHYDYWENKLLKSILIDSGADILTYGMGEKATEEIVYALKNGSALNGIKGTCIALDKDSVPPDAIMLPTFNEILNSKTLCAKSCKIQYDNCDYVTGKTLCEYSGDGIYLTAYPPQEPLDGENLDRIYEFPYTRNYHPIYEKDGGVPAIKEVKFSITHNRGCFGYCGFCSLAYHQGRTVTSRTKESIIKEAKSFLSYPDFKGYISDIGGPTANFRHASCKKQKTYGMCKNRRCLSPTPCKNLDADESEYLDILTSVREISGIKKVFVRSGIRFDFLSADKNDDLLYALAKHHISGQMKTAPEHCSEHVLGVMGKPMFSVYRNFCEKYKKINTKLGKKQYIVPYFMSSHPGCRLEDAIALAEYLNEINYTPLQVQDFYPTPGTMATNAYYTGINPFDMKKVYVPTDEEKAMQRALLQFKLPKNRDLVYKALIKCKRQDLIGYGKNCLIKPIPQKKQTLTYTLNGKKKTVKR